MSFACVCNHSKSSLLTIAFPGKRLSSFLTTKSTNHSLGLPLVFHPDIGTVHQYCGRNISVFLHVAKFSQLSDICFHLRGWRMDSHYRPERRPPPALVPGAQVWYFIKTASSQVGPLHKDIVRYTSRFQIFNTLYQSSLWFFWRQKIREAFHPDHRRQARHPRLWTGRRHDHVAASAGRGRAGWPAVARATFWAWWRAVIWAAWSSAAWSAQRSGGGVRGLGNRGEPEQDSDCDARFKSLSWLASTCFSRSSCWQSCVPRQCEPPPLLSRVSVRPWYSRTPVATAWPGGRTSRTMQARNW